MVDLYGTKRYLHMDVLMPDGQEPKEGKKMPSYTDVVNGIFAGRKKKPRSNP